MKFNEQFGDFHYRNTNENLYTLRRKLMTRRCHVYIMLLTPTS